MQQKPFYSLNKDSYQPISHGRSFLHEQYEAINSFIDLNFDEKFHGLIAKPIKSGEHVNWYNENISGEIKKLDKFEGQQGDDLKNKYNALVYSEAIAEAGKDELPDGVQAEERGVHARDRGGAQTQGVLHGRLDDAEGLADEVHAEVGEEHGD